MATECPKPTQDVELNLKNRQKAIDKFGYGPFNPNEDEDNVGFWQTKADMWKVDSDSAKKQLCGNCGAFNRTESMLDCISKGLGDTKSDWDVVDAGQLGYCEMFDFKCAASRTCDAWIDRSAKSSGAKANIVDVYLKTVQDLLNTIDTKADKIREGSFVAWGSSSGKARGRVEHVMREGTLGVPDSNFSIDASKDDPAVLIRIWREGKDGWGETEKLVGHRMSTLSSIDALSKKSYYISYIEHKATRKVRDSRYWGRPVGTPITPGMKPSGPTSPAGRARAAASASSSSSSKPSTSKPSTPKPKSRVAVPKPGGAAGGGGKKPPSKPKASSTGGNKPRGNRANQTSAERADAFLDWTRQFEGSPGDADKNIDVANALFENRDKTREAVIVGNGSDISDDNRRFIANILDGNPYVEIQQRENGLPKFKFTGDDEDSDILAERRKKAREMFDRHKLGPDEKPRRGQLVSVDVTMMGQKPGEGGRVIRVEGVRDGKVFGPTEDGLEELYIEDPVDVVRGGKKKPKERPKRRVASKKPVSRRVTVDVGDQARDAIQKRRERAAAREERSKGSDTVKDSKFEKVFNEDTEKEQYAPIPADQYDKEKVLEELKKISRDGRPEAEGTVEDPVDVGRDTVRARACLSEGKHIRMDSHIELGTLVDELAAIGADAKKKGEKAPDYDLCKVSVPETNLFCQESRNVPRNEMPQFKGVPQPGSLAEKMYNEKRAEVQKRIDAGETGPDGKPLELPDEADIEGMFMDFLSDMGITMDDKRLAASNLKATQDQLVGTQVAGMAKAIQAGTMPQRVLDSPVFVTEDGYILDGHHRWAALVAIDMEDGVQGDIDMPVRMIGADIGYILDLANAFADMTGVKRKSGGKKKPTGTTTVEAGSGESGSSSSQAAADGALGLLQGAQERGRVQ